MHKSAIETGSTIVDFVGGSLVDGASVFTGPAAPYVAVSGNILISVKIEKWKKSYYKDHDLE